MKLSKLSKQTLIELELLGISQEDLQLTLRAQGITDTDHLLAQCLAAMVKQIHGQELIQWPPRFELQDRGAEFTSRRWSL